MASIGGVSISVAASTVSSSPAAQIASRATQTARRAVGGPSDAHTPTRADSADLSQAALALYQVDQQIQNTSSTGFAAVLRSAASSLRAQAQGEADPGQAVALENLAARLQVAAGTSGLAALSPYGLTLLLGT